MGEKKLIIADSHIHLSHRSFENSFPFLAYDGERFTLEEGTRDELIDRMKESGIRFCIEPGIDLSSNTRVLMLADRYPGFIFPAVGIHPTRTWQYSETDPEGRRITKRLRWRSRTELAERSKNRRVTAIGETGLDYHLPRREQHRMRQILWFIWQLRLAHKRKLPVILHIRQADRHALLILRLHRRILHGGVCHCFSGTPDQARAYTALGLKLGIGASLLYEGDTGRNLKNVIRQTPLENVILETDGPYVKPPCPDIPGKRRKRARNTSLILPAVAERIAQLKGIGAEEVAAITTANAAELFGVPGDADVWPTKKDREGL